MFKFCLSHFTCLPILVFAMAIITVVAASLAPRSNLFWVDVDGNPLQVRIEDVDRNQEVVLHWDHSTGQPDNVGVADLSEHVDR